MICPWSMHGSVHVGVSIPLTLKLTVLQHTVIWLYFVLYLILYAAVRTKIKRTNNFQQRDFHMCFVYACVVSSFTVPCFCPPSSFSSLLASLLASPLASVLASLLLRECRCPFLYNNSVAISLVTGLSVTCEVFSYYSPPHFLVHMVTSHASYSYRR